MPARVEPPESASAPSVCVRIETSCVAEDEQQREPDADRGDDLGGDPGPDHRDRAGSTPSAPDRRADENEDHSRHHDRVRGRLDAEQGQRPGRAEVGDRRVGRAVGADRDPAAEPAVGGADRGGGSTGRRRRRSGTPTRARRTRRAAGTGRRVRPAAPTPTPGPATVSADEHDGVEPDDRRDRREAERRVVEDAAARA